MPNRDNVFYMQDDPMKPALGIFRGVILGAVVWILAGGFVWVIYRLLNHKHFTPWGW